MNMVFALISLLLATVIACFSTPRARPAINGYAGWTAVLVLFGLAVFELTPVLDIAVAIAVALCGFMAAIPLVALYAGVRQRQGARHE